MQTRITIIDEFDTVSFVAPVYLLKMVAAACSRGARGLRDLLAALGAFDPERSSQLLDQLDANPTSESEASDDDEDDPDHQNLIRVVDEDLRQQSLQAVDGGLVIFNLPAKRIVQISIASGPIPREGRGRMRRNGRSVSVYYSYTLPSEWSIVP